MLVIEFNLLICLIFEYKKNINKNDCWKNKKKEKSQKE